MSLTRLFVPPPFAKLAGRHVADRPPCCLLTQPAPRFSFRRSDPFEFACELHTCASTLDPMLSRHCSSQKPVNDPRSAHHGSLYRNSAATLDLCPAELRTVARRQGTKIERPAHLATTRLVNTHDELLRRARAGHAEKYRVRSSGGNVVLLVFFFVQHERRRDEGHECVRDASTREPNPLSSRGKQPAGGTQPFATSVGAGHFVVAGDEKVGWLVTTRLAANADDSSTHSSLSKSCGAPPGTWRPESFLSLPGACSCSESRCTRNNLWPRAGRSSAPSALCLDLHPLRGVGFWRVWFRRPRRAESRRSRRRRQVYRTRKNPEPWLGQESFVGRDSRPDSGARAQVGADGSLRPPERSPRGRRRLHRPL